jgi:hypothetical protein
MKLKDKVTSLELSKLLYEKGITKDYESVFYWYKFGRAYRISTLLRTPYVAPALLLSELMELMPGFIVMQKEGDEWCFYQNDEAFGAPCGFHAIDLFMITNTGEGKTPLKALEALAKHLITKDLWKT